MTTWYCLRWPPSTVTWDTPSTARSRFRAVNSANVRSSIPARRSASGVLGGSAGRRATSITSPISDDTGAITGVTPAGSRSRTSCSRSATTCRSWMTSVPQSNSTQTTDSPMPEADRTRRTPAAPVSWYSIGRVTRASTSSGARPGASVMTATVGRFRSGNTSTGVRASWTRPAAATTTAAASTSPRFFRENPITRSNTVPPPSPPLL